MTKIILIQPFGDESNTNYPPIGLLYLASYLRSRMECAITVLDLRLTRTPIEQKLEDIQLLSPHIVGITGMSVEWSNIKHIIKTLRQALGKSVTLVAGGPHATAFSNIVLEQTPVDFIVKGEGEETFLQLVRMVVCGGDPKKINGIAFRGDDGILHETAVRDWIANIDDLPFPAYDLIDLEAYFVNPHFHNNLNRHNRILPLLTSRGCPLKCTFCYHLMGEKFRFRSPENLLQEIEWLVETYRIREFHIEDDIFNFDMTRATEIMKRIESLGYDLSFAFPNGLKIELIDEKMIAQFKRSGVYRVNLGIESVVPRIQHIVCKPVDLNRVDRVIDWLNKEKISSHGFFMIGFPDETEEEIRQTIHYAVRSRLATANFSLVKIFPMTPLGHKYLANVNFTDDHSFGYDSVSTNLTRVSDDKLKSLEKEAYARFYFSPIRIWRIFRTSPNKRNLFFRNFFTVLSLVFRGKTKY